MELEKIAISTFFLHPELMDTVRVKPEWLEGGYDQYFTWIKTEYEKAPGTRIRLSLCPFDPQPVDESISYSDPGKIESVATILRDRYLKRNFADLCRDGVKNSKLDEPDKWISQHVEKVQGLVNDTEELDIPHVSMQVQETLDKIAERMDIVASGQRVVGITTGNDKLDEALGGWERKENVIIAGRPGMGKTTCALDFAIAAARSGVTVDIYSLEMDKHKLLVKMGCQVANLSLMDAVKGRLSEDEFLEFNKALDQLKELPIFMHDKCMRWDQIQSSARRQNAIYDTGILIIDYLQLIEGGGGKQNREQEVSKMSRSIKNLGTELNCCTLTLSQLSRQVEHRVDKKPRLSDLRESGSIEQDADIVIFPFRKIYYYEMDGSYETEDGDAPHTGTDFYIPKFRMGDTCVVEFEEPEQDDFNSITPRRSIPEEPFWEKF